MKLSELFLTQEDFAKKQEQKSQALKQAVESGDTPDIHNAGGTIKGWAWGDLKELGWAEKERESQSGHLVDERWLYTGPKPIKLITSGGQPKIMNSGDATDWVEVDYS